MSDQPTIFVVDDDDAVRMGVIMSLETRGYHVEAFSSAENFLDAWAVDRAGCLLLDVRMPRTTGLELQDKLRRRGSQIPIIFLSAYGDIPMTVRAMRKGAIDFLEKPYDISILLARIEEALTKDQENRDARARNDEIRSRLERLTSREREVMKLVVAGAATTSNRMIAEQLGISHRTVETYRARLMEKMQARSVPDLVQMGKICGIYKP